MNDIAIALITATSIIIPAYLLYKKDIKKLNIEINAHKLEKDELKIKADVLDRVLDFTSFNAIKLAVDEIFKTTVADRFLILIAVNGKTKFNMVSVIFEQHKCNKYHINAIARYRSLTIDDDYREMLKKAEQQGIVELETETMPECLLKNIYKIEGVKFSAVRHILRLSVDHDNDILIYSSLSTHNDKGFTKTSKVRSQIIYDSQIKETLFEVLKKN